MDERHYLTPLFEPQCVAVVGASERRDALGAVIVRNMLEANFRGKLFGVNPKYSQVQGVACVPSIGDVPVQVDLVVITTPAHTVPKLIEECVSAKVKAAVMLCSDFGDAANKDKKLESKIVQTARENGLRLLGPNSLGLSRPSVGLNATFAHSKPIAGSIGFISQSGALCAAILDYSSPNYVGFSNVVSMGLASDLDFGEVLDYMAGDWRTESILLYVEGIRDARRFLSGLRAAARVKPIMVLKVGRHPVGVRAARSHNQALGTEDAVFDAALRRSGVIRLNNLSQLYAASKALFAHFHPRGNRLAIITNGGGPGVMAADRAGDLGIALAQPSEATISQLSRILPEHCSLENPIDLVGDSDPERYAAALKALLADDEVDGVLCLLTPQAMTQPEVVAQRVIDLHKGSKKPVLTCWLGEEQSEASRKLFRIAGIPTLRTPEIAVELFSHLSSYYRNQQLLTQVPAPLADGRRALTASARILIENALAEHREHLTRHESMALLAAFHLPITPVQVAHTVEEALNIATQTGFPLLLRPNKTEQTSEQNLIRLNLTSREALATAFAQITQQIAPESAKEGLCLETMRVSKNRYEMMVRIWRDPVFGPVIGFGEAPREENFWPDRAVALPPLNTFLAKDLIKHTHAAIEIEAQHGEAALEKLELLLLRLSEMACELPWLRTLTLNPIVMDDSGLWIAHARVELGEKPANANYYDHMAIHPYPATLVTEATLREGTHVLIRPMKPEDAELVQTFVRKLSPQTKFFRFMNALRELSPAMLAKLTQSDYDKEIAFIATIERAEPEAIVGVTEEQIGVCRYNTNPDGTSCEFAIVVSDDYQKSGLGRQLMQVLIRAAASRGLKTMKGVFLSDNDRMLKFVQAMGFVLTPDPEDNSVKNGVLDLQKAMKEI